MTTFRLRPLMVVAASLLILAAGCKKAPAPEPAAAPTPAPAAAAPAPAPAPVVAPVTVSADSVTSTATSGDGKSVDWALKQEDIKNDPQGQWASGATASSSYGDAKEQERYSPWQATGVPNVDQESDNAAAWTSKTADAGMEWLDLTFPNAVHATGLRVRESDGAGAIVRVEMFDDSGAVHNLWTGTDPTKGLNYFVLTFPKTTYKTNHVKIMLATNMVQGWNEIDAVQLLGTDK
ncbi:MAG TPA: hypothetical protein VFC39_15180 [Acidobacteriaceae bacterium]|nr:hypothetical protein [Acidobacteriaceae bacterium]